MKFYSIYNNRLDFKHLVSCLSKASSKCCLPFGPGKSSQDVCLHSVHFFGKI